MIDFEDGAGRHSQPAPPPEQVAESAAPLRPSVVLGADDYDALLAERDRLVEERDELQERLSEVYEQDGRND